MKDEGELRPRREWIKWVVCGLLLVLAVAASAVKLALERSEPFLRARIIASLQERFHARVELDSFHVSMANGLWAEGEGLRIWPPENHPGDAAVPTSQGEPLIRLAEFRFHTPLDYWPGRPIHIALVELKGLSVHLPPKSHYAHPAAAYEPLRGVDKLLSFQVDTMECTGADLLLESSKPGKLPMDFAISWLKLTGIATGRAISYEAELTNPRPRGTIKTVGSFGPLRGTDLGADPVSGNFRLEHADLASFKGIAGTLDSAGHYQGTLRELAVDGETETPDFRLTHFGNALPLHTRYHALVDGTNGDTWLNSVEATLGRSHFTTQGQIVRAVRVDADGALHGAGHNIALSVNVDRARIEDFLLLASHSATPQLTGVVMAKSSLLIPPGAAPVHERIKLDGSFALDQARFASDKIQGRIAELSLRGQGRPNEVKSIDPSSILSRMQGAFQLGGGVLTLPALDYSVPGAEIQLKGTYGLENGVIDFTGSAKMEATVSKMLGGWKGFLLKPADRFFRKDGAGTEVPIHIGGTRKEPKIGIGAEQTKAAGKR
jgi:hypothetical protein